ncbi:P450 monooxygenase [Metarhizium rileyi]|uniref:P450 monooxygenase n=1 Tax=Metarhizium rileyi (strain RCEF 4871) TaxID=1649241 RepID=A0A166WLM6_METRR|nr:P450 monooxygenase [Metarhizium rileyi RCEF 4871]
MPIANGDAAADPRDAQYWSHNFVSPLKSLLNAAGSYTIADQEAQVRLLEKHVLPNLGPRPSKANGPSFLTQSGSPLQLSLNASSNNCVRYCWEMLGASRQEGDDPLAIQAAQNIMASLAANFGLSTKWSSALLSAFAVNSKEAQKIVDMLPEWLQSFVPEGVEAAPLKRIPFALSAFDLKGSSISMKLYVNPKAKEIMTGTPAAGEVWNILRHLTPAFKPEAIEMLEKFFAGIPEPSPIELVGIDCVDEAHLSEARVKLYIHTRSNSFNTVRKYVTLGGIINDEETKTYLDKLHPIWHLLLQQPEGPVDDDFEKPINDSSMLCQKLYFSFELQPGKDFPNVKTYLPTWNYVRSDEETIQNYEEIFRLCGHPWGEEGVYKKIFTDAFGPATHGRKKPVHCDASYLFTEKKGVYQTLYFSPPLGDERDSQ